MQTSFIIMLALGGLGLLTAIAIVAQKLEARRQALARQSRHLRTRIRQFWSALTELPPSFLTPNLKTYLVQGIRADLAQLRQLQPGSPEISQYTTALQKIIPQIQQETATAPPLSFENDAQIREARARLRALNILVGNMRDSGLMDAAATSQFMNRINEINGETLILLYLSMARNAIDELKPAVAVHQLDLCINEIEKLNQHGAWTEKLAELRRLQGNVEQYGAFTEEDGTAIQQKLAEEKTRLEENRGNLGEQIDTMMEDDDSWKKKAQYD